MTNMVQQIAEWATRPGSCDGGGLSVRPLFDRAITGKTLGYEPSSLWTGYGR